MFADAMRELYFGWAFFLITSVRWMISHAYVLSCKTLKLSTSIAFHIHYSIVQGQEATDVCS